ncbi:MAG: BNR-4 repeat-containing protein, partial [Thermoleophilaceae bacterium]|nr:BNR-4 repeat-containing protein [Thermoleophilaceae bacterium]
MLRRTSATITVLLALLALPTAASAADGNVTKIAVEQEFQQFTAGGAWSFFGDPRAVEAGGKRFIGWTTMIGQIQVSEQNPRTGKIRTVTLGPRMEEGNDHQNPSLLVRPDGRITAFYSPHSGRLRPKKRKSQLYYRTTVKPADISEWSAVKTIPTNTFDGHLGYTYPNPVPLSGNRIFLTWRGGDWLPGMAVLSNN